VATVDACPRCASSLLQALRWHHLPGGSLDVRLRCPDCETCFRVDQTPQEARDLDRRQAAGRDAVLSAYEAAVRDSMAELAETLGAALARDLLSADDFARRPAVP